MPYFFILPAFVLYFIAMSLAIVVTALYQPAAHLRRYLASALVWSSLGFVVSTVVYAILLVALFNALGQVTGGKPSVAGGVAMATMVFIAPVVTSAAGLLGGGVFGLRRVKRCA